MHTLKIDRVLIWWQVALIKSTHTSRARMVIEDIFCKAFISHLVSIYRLTDQPNIHVINLTDRKEKTKRQYCLSLTVLALKLWQKRKKIHDGVLIL